MKRIQTLVMVLLMPILFVAVPVIGPKSVNAFDAWEQTCGAGGAPDSTVCQEKANATDPVTGANALIPKIANIIALIGGILAIIFIMLNGLKYMTSQGDPGKTNEAKNGLIYASIGIVVIVLARLVVQFALRFV